MDSFLAKWHVSLETVSRAGILWNGVLDIYCGWLLLKTNLDSKLCIYIFKNGLG